MDKTRLSEVLISKTLEFDDNEVIGGGDNNKLNNKLFMFRKILVLKCAFIFLRLLFYQYLDWDQILKKLIF